MSSDSSRLRHGLLQAGELVQQRILDVLNHREPIIHGSFGKRGRACGKSTCRCARGELHEQTYLSVTVEGKTRQVHVPKADEEHVRVGVARYQTLLQARRRLREVALQALRLAKELSISLMEPYPPDDPLPRPRSRKDGGKPR